MIGKDKVLEGLNWFMLLVSRGYMYFSFCSMI